jgi:hypothetical protein
MFCVFFNLTTPHSFEIVEIKVIHLHLLFIYSQKRLSLKTTKMLHAFASFNFMSFFMLKMFIMFHVWHHNLLLCMVIVDDIWLLTIFLISDHNIQHSNKCKKPPISSDVKIYIENYSWWTLSTIETNGVSLMTLTNIWIMESDNIK